MELWKWPLVQKWTSGHSTIPRLKSPPLATTDIHLFYINIVTSGGVQIEWLLMKGKIKCIKV